MVTERLEMDSEQTAEGQTSAVNHPIKQENQAEGPSAALPQSEGTQGKTATRDSLEEGSPPAAIARETAPAPETLEAQEGSASIHAKANVPEMEGSEASSSDANTARAGEEESLEGSKAQDADEADIAGNAAPEAASKKDAATGAAVEGENSSADTEEPTEDQETPTSKGDAGEEDSEEAMDGEDEADEEKRESPPRPRQPTYVETLERRLADTQDQLREYIQAYKQVKSDMDDFKARLEREAAKDLDVLRGKLVTELLEVLDNLDRSVQGGHSGWDAAALLQGIEMVQIQFIDKLKSLGLKTIEPLGEVFDPNIAEALAVVPTDDPEKDNRVTNVYARGFMLKDRVIRPARVVVGRYDENASSAS